MQDELQDIRGVLGLEMNFGQEIIRADMSCPDMEAELLWDTSMPDFSFEIPTSEDADLLNTKGIDLQTDGECHFSGQDEWVSWHPLLDLVEPGQVIMQGELRPGLDGVIEQFECLEALGLLDVAEPEKVKRKAKEARVLLEDMEEKMAGEAGQDLEYQREYSAWRLLLELVEQGQVIMHGETVLKHDAAHELQSDGDSLEQLRATGMMVAAGKLASMQPVGRTAHVKNVVAASEENLPSGKDTRSQGQGSSLVGGAGQGLEQQNGCPVWHSLRGLVDPVERVSEEDMDLCYLWSDGECHTSGQDECWTWHPLFNLYYLVTNFLVLLNLGWASPRGTKSWTGR